MAANSLAYTQPSNQKPTGNLTMSVNNSISGAMNSLYGGSAPKQTLASSQPTSITGTGKVGPIKLPTSVVSSNTATNTVKNVIAPTIKNQNLANTNQIQSPYNTVDGSLTDYGKANGFKDVNSNSYNKTDTTTTTPPPPKTLEDHVADQTLHPGQVQLYNLQTGQQEWVAPNSPGYSISNPTTRTDVNDTADVGNGIQYKKFSDGTYGRFDESGNYSVATSQAFSDAKNQESIADKIKSIQNGTFVLPANQQTQLDGISAKYADLINKQSIENANVTGNTTIAENLYGLGNTLIGKGEITKTVNDGIQKIANLQTELASALATMTDAFQKDDMASLKDSYDKYIDYQKQTQAEMDKVTAYLQSQQDKQDTKNETFALQQMSRYGDANIEASDTPAQIQDKKQKNSAIYNQELATKAGQVDQNVLDGMLAIYNKTGTIPAGMGNASVELKKAFYAAVGGHPGLVDAATANKAAVAGATKALATQTNQYAGNQTSIQTLDKQLGLVQKYSNQVDRPGSPLIAKYVLWLKGTGAGDADTAALNNIVKTASTEFARILSGATASIASTPVSTQDDAEKLLNSAMSKGQFTEVLNLMKQEANFRLTSQKSTIDQLKEDLKNIGTTNNSSSTSGSTSNSSGWGWKP